MQGSWANLFISDCRQSVDRHNQDIHIYAYNSTRLCYSDGVIVHHPYKRQLEEMDTVRSEGETPAFGAISFVVFLVNTASPEVGCLVTKLLFAVWGGLL